MLVDRIKHDDPDLPKLILDTQCKNGGSVYMRSQRFDPYLARDLKRLSSDGQFLLDYLHMNEKQSNEEAED